MLKATAIVISAAMIFSAAIPVKRMVERVSLTYLLSGHGSEERVRHTETRYEFDKLKSDDFIVKPFHYAGSFELTPEERDLVERIVMHESGWCPDYRLLILTAQCVRNWCEMNAARPPRAFSECGYAAMNYANPRSRKAVHDVFDRGIKCVEENIFCFYNRNLTSSALHESQNLAIDIDGNRFFY